MADDNALWTIQFEAAGEWRTGGVVVFDRGRVFGGDGSYYYFGRYTEDGNAIRGEVRIVHYNGPLAAGFGSSPDFTVILELRRSRDLISGSIHKPGTDTARLQLRCIRRETLPPAQS